MGGPASLKVLEGLSILHHTPRDECAFWQMAYKKQGDLASTFIFSQPGQAQEGHGGMGVALYFVRVL
eukprot:3824088-Amphidinium_carterae.1